MRGRDRVPRMSSQYIVADSCGGISCHTLPSLMSLHTNVAQELGLWLRDRLQLAMDKSGKAERLAWLGWAIFGSGTAPSMSLVVSEDISRSGFVRYGFSRG